MTGELEPFESLESAPGEEPEPSPARGRHRRTWKIAWVLCALLLVFALLPLYSVSVRLAQLNRESLNTQQQSNQILLAASVANLFDGFVAGQERGLLALTTALSAEAGRSGPDGFGESAAARELLAAAADDEVLFLRYTHRDGTWLETGTAPRGEAIEAALAEAFILQMNAGARGAVAVGEPFWDDLTEGPVVTLSAPVVADGRRVGVLTALASLEPIWRDARRASGGYTLFAVNAGGEVFTQAPGTPVAGDFAYQDLDIVREFVRSGGNRVLPYDARRGDGVVVRLVGSSHETRARWGVFIQAAEESAYQMQREMQWRTLFYALLAAAAALVFGVLAAGWISRPIKRLADSSLAFAEGDFTARVPVGPGNEVGELAETFNLMAETLEKYIARIRRAALENSELFLGSIQALAAAIDEKDAYTRGHSERVRRYAVVIARRLGLSPAEVRNVEIGALLHDVGKIGIEDRILNKPGPLTPEEYEIMKTHPERGANIMAPIRPMRDILPSLKHHHERWDGTGYPAGLNADGIPLSARIVTVADVWDAMTTNRPYQRAMALEEGLERMEFLAGRMFDPAVARAFVDAMRQGELVEVYDQARKQVRATAAKVDPAAAARSTGEVLRDGNFDPDCAPPPLRA